MRKKIEEEIKWIYRNEVKEEKSLFLLSFFFQGCLTKFETFVKDNVFIIGGVGIGLAFVQVKMILRKSIMGPLFSVEPNSEN